MKTPSRIGFATVASLVLLGLAVATVTPTAAADPVGDLTWFVACAPQLIDQLKALLLHIADDALTLVQQAKCALSPRCYSPTLVPLNLVCYTLSGAVGCGLYAGLFIVATGCNGFPVQVGALYAGCRVYVLTPATSTCV